MVLEIAKFLCGCHGSASALGALPLSPYLPMTLTLTCWPSQCCKYYSQTTIRGCWDSVSHFTLLGVLTANFSWYHLGVRFTQKEERDKVKPYKTIRCIVFPPECQSSSMCHSRCQTVPLCLLIFWLTLTSTENLTNTEDLRRASFSMPFVPLT